MFCKVCNLTSILVATSTQTRKYWHCPHCNFLFLDPSCYFSINQERYRYSQHKNSLSDTNYVAFLSTLVAMVTEIFPPGSRGLDYGSGPSLSLEPLLQVKGYQMQSYDLHFLNLEISEKFDFITCCEVAEHFHDPILELKKIRRLLKDDGYLFLKSLLYEGQDPLRWHYSRDITHTSFFSQSNLEILRQSCGFRFLKVPDCRHVILIA